MKVFEIHYDNGESYEDHYWKIEAIFSSKELADQYCKFLNNNITRDMWNKHEEYSVIEHEVLDELPIIKANEVTPALSDEEVMEMNQQEHSRDDWRAEQI